MAGASLMFFGFLGFESISMTVDEIKEPQKNVPRGIVLALIIVASLYAVVSLVLTGVVHYTKLNVDDAVAYALRYIGISWAANYVSVVAIMTLITVCISMAYALSRMVYSLAREGFLPQTFQKVSKTNKVPHHATLLTGVLSAISAGIFSLANMASLVNIATLAYLVLLAIALIQGSVCSGLAYYFNYRLSLLYESVQLADMVSLWFGSANRFSDLCLLRLQTF